MNIVRQKNEKDCGLYVIKALYENIYKSKVKIDTLRSKAFITNVGLSILSLSHLGKEFGLNLTSYEAKSDSILKQKNGEFIALVNGQGSNHFVIIKIQSDHVIVYDSIKGKLKLFYEEFEKIYKGVVLTIDKIPNYDRKVNQIKSNSLLAFVIKKPVLMSWIMALVILELILSFIGGMFMKLAFDLVLPNQIYKMLYMLVIMFVSIGIFNSLNSFFKTLLIKKLFYYLEWDIFLKFNDKLKNSNFNDVNKFTFNDVFRKEVMIQPISTFLGSSIFVLFSDGITMIAASGILMWLSFKLFSLAFIFAISFILVSLFLQRMIFKNYDNILDINLDYLNKKQDCIKNSLDSKERSRSNFAFENLNKSFIKLKYATNFNWKISVIDGLFERVINLVAPIIITFLTIKMIFSNEFTIGNMLFFLTVDGFFVASFASISQYLLVLPQNIKNINVLKELLDLKDEQSNENGLSLEKLKSISINHLRFGYADNIINIPSLNINNPMKIKGLNGSGKSTFLKLLSLSISGSGEILFNGIEKDFYNKNKIRDKIFHIRPETILFSDTLINNITFNDETKLNILNDAIKKHNLIPFLKKNNLDLNKVVIDNGSNFSSGQKQIVLLLRLLCTQYDLILLDEALENISKDNIYFLKKILTETQQTKLWIEVSNSGKYINDKLKEVDFATFNKS